MSKSMQSKDTRTTPQQRSNGSAEARMSAHDSGDGNSESAESPRVKAQATDSQTDAHSAPQSEAQSEASGHQQPQDDISIQEVIDTFSDLITAKKLQWQAQWSLVTAEARVLRQSVLVTVLATLATFAFACGCWLIINVTAAVLLSANDVHPALIGFLLLSVNGALMAFAWLTAKQAFKHLTLVPLFNACRGEPDQTKKTRNKPVS